MLRHSQCDVGGILEEPLARDGNSTASLIGDLATIFGRFRYLIVTFKEKFGNLLVRAVSQGPDFPGDVIANVGELQQGSWAGAKPNSSLINHPRTQRDWKLDA